MRQYYKHFTATCPSVSSSLQITNRTFRYASPYLWNQLPSSFRQLHSVHFPPGSPHPAHNHLITVTTQLLPSHSFDLLLHLDMKSTMTKRNDERMTRRGELKTKCIVKRINCKESVNITTQKWNEQKRPNNQTRYKITQNNYNNNDTKQNTDTI